MDNESIRSKLSEFITANPKTTGKVAFEHLVKEGFDSKDAFEVVKEYGKEEVTGVPQGTEPTVKSEDVTVLPKAVTTEAVESLNTNIVNSAQENQSTMNNKTNSKKTSSHEAEAPIVDDGAAKGTQTDGVLADGGGGNTPTEGDIWDAETEKQTPVAGKGNATSRGAPSGPAGDVQVSENRPRRFNSGDIKSEKKRVMEYYRKLDRLEAGRNMKVADARIAAKERYLKEKRLDSLIKKAKEGSKARAVVAPRISRKAGEGVARKVSAQEAEVYGPLQWMKAVAKELNVPASYLWKINKQDAFESSNSRFIKGFDANENVTFTPLTQEQKKPAATEAVTGPATGDFMRIMSEQVLVLPNGKVVTPIRQFCETKVLPPGTREAFFYDFGAVTFSDVTEDGSTQVGESAVVMRSAGGNASPRGTRLTLGYTQLEESPIDIIAAANRSYALESVNDESIEALQRAYDDDTGSSGDATTRKAKGGGVKTGRWVDNQGNQITADATGNGNMTFAGLVAAKGVIEDEGLDPSNIITYTTGKAIRDLIFDPDLDSFISFSRPAIITEATVERIAGTNVVRSSAPADGTEALSKRSVMFIPNIALGLVTGRDLTMEAQRRNELQSVFLTGTQRIAVYVKNVEATCRISHL